MMLLHATDKCVRPQRRRERQRLRGTARHVDPLVVIGGVRYWPGLAPPPSSSWCEINRDNYVAATSTSTSAASDNCCWGSPPYRGARAQRPPPAGDPPQAGNVCSFELGTGKPALGRSGNCAPTSLTRRGTQMDLGPPALYCRRHVTIGKCRTIHKPPSKPVNSQGESPPNGWGSPGWAFPTHNTLCGRKVAATRHNRDAALLPTPGHQAAQRQPAIRSLRLPTPTSGELPEATNPALPSKRESSSPHTRPN
jgi:hypothetical protein